jgi:hypothetical protein
MILLAEHFRKGHNTAYAERLRQQFFHDQQKDQKNRKDQLADDVDSDLMSFAMDIVMASETQLLEFDNRLDQYEHITIEAIVLKQEELDKLLETRNQLLSDAYVMEDGRRVFKSEDGSYVIDEHRQYVSPQELDYNLLHSGHPAAEIFEANEDKFDTVKQELQQLHTFHEKIDEARDRRAEGNITEKELQEMDKEFLEMMPASVKARIPDLETSTEAEQNISAQRDIRPDLVLQGMAPPSI